MNEADILARYLTSHSATAAQHTLYSRVVAGRPQTASMHRILAKPYLLGMVDAYDALFRPNSELRSRLYLMFSILEAAPVHTELFLPVSRPKWYTLQIVLYGIHAGLRLIGGFALVKLGRY